MIKTLWIKSFRCLTELTLDFTQSKFISIISENNVGKTSVLEACHILSHLKSFVTSDIREIIPFSGNSVMMGIKIENNRRDKNYYLKINREGKKFISVDQHVVKRKSDIESLFRSVYISSDSLHLITTTPKFRRDEIDSMISQISISYRTNYAHYRKLINQKNKALKHGAGDAVLYHLNEQIVQFMIEIMKERYHYISKLIEKMCLLFNKIHSVRGVLSISYKPTMVYDKQPQVIIDTLREALPKERVLKASILGPHREDYEFLIDGKLCKNFYSRGVCRIVSYLFYIAKAMIIAEKTRLPMLLLLDEPFSEIHINLKKQLFEYIPKSFFIMYTSTQLDEISSMNPDSLFSIEHGELCRR